MLQRCQRRGEDVWCWNTEESERFSVKSSYNLVYDLLILNVLLSNSEEMVFASIWKSAAPCKIVVFSWKLLLDRISTRANLARRNVFLQGAFMNCIFRGRGEESSAHIFLNCDVVMKVWEKVFRWLDFNFLIAHNLFVHFECRSGEVWNKKLWGLLVKFACGYMDVVED